jgi:hypothetical protein
MNSRKFAHLGLFVFCTFIFATSCWAQSSGTITGVVKDATGGVLTNASVEISDVVSGYHRETTTGTAGDFRFTNIPFNTYHMVVKASGFSNYTQDVDVRSSVPATVDIGLKVGTTSENITVEATGADLVETESTPHTDVDRELFDKLPLESASSSLSSLVTLASPGVVADSNGLFHGLGDHAENSFSVDGQPITDQQSKVFSNQLPVDSIQSMEVISGAPPAEYGDKTSLVIKVTTRSGLGQTQPTGSVTTSYGSFGSTTVGGNLAIGGSKWGNFVSLNGLNTGRFLDPPEFEVFQIMPSNRSLELESLTTSKRRIPFFGFHTLASWRLRSTRIWSSPAQRAILWQRPSLEQRHRFFLGSGMNSTQDSNRPLGSISWSMPITCGNIRTTDMTSAIS